MTTYNRLLDSRNSACSDHCTCQTANASVQKFHLNFANNVAFADAIKAVASMDLEGKNAMKSPRVFTDEIRLSKSELEELIHKTVKKAIEEEREVMLQGFKMKMNDAVEKRDRLLTTQMRKNLEEKTFEIAASKEEEYKKKWWKFWD